METNLLEISRFWNEISMFGATDGKRILRVMNTVARSRGIVSSSRVFYFAWKSGRRFISEFLDDFRFEI